MCPGRVRTTGDLVLDVLVRVPVSMLVAPVL
jgi:hypothetical protein